MFTKEHEETHIYLTNLGELSVTNTYLLFYDKIGEGAFRSEKIHTLLHADWMTEELAKDYAQYVDRGYARPIPSFLETDAEPLAINQASDRKDDK